MKTAIIYYSLEGSTKFVAETLASELSSDLIELHPVKEIPKTWFMKYFWWGKQVMMKESVKLKPYSFNKDDYDLIIVGTPVWAFTYSPPIRSFFDTYSLENKKTAFFCCHEGGPKNTIQDMMNICEQSEIIGWKDFLKVFARKEEIVTEIKEWVKELENKK